MLLNPFFKLGVDMGKDEAKAIISELKKNTKKNITTKETAIKALRDAGLINSQGKTSKQYCV